MHFLSCFQRSRLFWILDFRTSKINERVAVAVAIVEKERTKLSPSHLRPSKEFSGVFNAVDPTEPFPGSIPSFIEEKAPRNICCSDTYLDIVADSDLEKPCGNNIYGFDS